MKDAEVGESLDLSEVLGGTVVTSVVTGVFEDDLSGGGEVDHVANRNGPMGPGGAEIRPPEPVPSTF